MTLPIMNRKKATAHGEKFITASFAAILVNENKKETPAIARKIVPLFSLVFTVFKFREELSRFDYVLMIFFSKFLDKKVFFISYMPCPKYTYGYN